MIFLYQLKKYPEKTIRKIPPTLRFPHMSRDPKVAKLFVDHRRWVWSGLGICQVTSCDFTRRPVKPKCGAASALTHTTSIVFQCIQTNGAHVWKIRENQGNTHVLNACLRQLPSPRISHNEAWTRWLPRKHSFAANGCSSPSIFRIFFMVSFILTKKHQATSKQIQPSNQYQPSHGFQTPCVYPGSCLSTVPVDFREGL